VFRLYKSLDCLKLTIPGFLYNLLPLSCGDNGCKKCLDQVLAWKSGHKVPLLPTSTLFKLFCWVIWSDEAAHCRLYWPFVRIFFKFVRPNGHYSLHRAATPNPAKKCAKNHNKLQQAVIPDWMGSITLRGYITVCFS
jgi:hypothetical protein